MNDFDLSHLLQEAPTPPSGPSRVRKIAKQRQHRRQALAGSLGAVTIVGLASVLALSSNGSGPAGVMVGEQANNSKETTTTLISTTVAPKPTSHQAYIGVKFDETGFGAPLGVQVISLVGTGNEKVGDRALVVAEDELGAMIWVTKVLRPADYSKNIRQRQEVVGVIDIAKGPDDEQFVCAGTCVRAGGTTDPLVVAFLNLEQGDSVAYRVDPKKMTAKTIDASGWGITEPSPEAPQEAPLLARPDAYRVAGSTQDPDLVSRYEAVGIMQRGYGAIDFATFGQIRMLQDIAQNKHVAVYTAPSGDVTDVLVLDDNGQNRFVGGPMYATVGGWAYKGKPSELTIALVLNENEVMAAYKVDPGSKKFVKVNSADVTKVTS